MRQLLLFSEPVELKVDDRVYFEDKDHLHTSQEVEGLLEGAVGTIKEIHGSYSTVYFLGYGFMLCHLSTLHLQ